MTKTIAEPCYHFISHTHWDREWYWPFERFRQDLVDLIDTLIDLMERRPEYQFFTLDGQTVVLEDYREIRPERFPAVRKLVQEGRLYIGPWYVLGDAFLVNVESIVRNLLVGKEVGALAGPVMPVGYLPDTFSHIAMMPAILQGFGIPYAVVWRGFGGEPGQDQSEYWWRAPNGDRVLMVHLPPNGYGDAYIGENRPETFLEKGRRLQEILDARALTPHRLCMNGGDHHFPEPYLPEALRLMSEKLPGQFVHSNLPSFFAQLDAWISENRISLQEVVGELRWGYRYAFAVQSGVYSSRIFLKQANVACETALLRYAEPIALWATLLGRQGLQATLRHGWKLLLQNHAHDSICGCSIDAVHEEMMTRFARCRQVAEGVIDRSLQHFYPDGWRGEDRILIFNPLPWSVDQPVQAKIEFYRRDIVVGLNPDVHPEPPKPVVRRFRLVTEDGREVPYQVLQDEPDAHGLRFRRYSYPSKRLVHRYTLLVDARDLPGLGFTRLRVQRRAPKEKIDTDLVVGDNLLENRHLRVEFHKNGTLSIEHRESGHCFSGQHYFEDSGDAGDAYNYSPPREDRRVTSLEDTPVALRLIESGPLRATMEMHLTLTVPQGLADDRNRRADTLVYLPIRTRVSLYAGQPRVEFETYVENRARDHRLRVVFPTGLATRQSFADSAFCIVQRTHEPVDASQFRIEVPSPVHPMQRAVTVMDETMGLTLVTAGLPEYELSSDGSGTLSLTLLRSVGRMSGGDLLMRPGGEAGWITETPGAQCPGSHCFRYAIIPHRRSEFESYAPINRQIELFRNPPVAFRRGGDPRVPLEHLGFEVEPASLVLSACKVAQDGRGAVLRFYNPTERQVQALIRSRLPVVQAWKCRLDEQDQELLSPVHGGTLQLKVDAFTVVTLRLLLDMPRIQENPK